MALGILAAAGCSVAVLTKGGTRCLRDFDLFQSWPGGRIKVGASLTFDDKMKSEANEPGAAPPDDRLDALEYLHRKGIRTWVSAEPVIEGDESLWMIHRSLPWVDEYALGAISGTRSNVHWERYLGRATEMLWRAKKRFYVKEALRLLAPGVELSKEERDSETLFVEDRE
jgi:hypothetical protein